MVCMWVCVCVGEWICTLRCSSFAAQAPAPYQMNAFESRVALRSVSADSVNSAAVRAALSPIDNLDGDRSVVHMHMHDHAGYEQRSSTPGGLSSLAEDRLHSGRLLDRRVPADAQAPTAHAGAPTWLHGRLSKPTAGALVEAEGSDGAFCVWDLGNAEAGGLPFVGCTCVLRCNLSACPVCTRAPFSGLNHFRSHFRPRFAEIMIHRAVTEMSGRDSWCWSVLAPCRPRLHTAQRVGTYGGVCVRPPQCTAELGVFQHECR
jgi:hypothetical protein